jgi:glycosyltransferase involved in cell wall biosynthesis
MLNDISIKNKIVVITTNPFPVGLAGTNRILSYGKGFIHHGYQPEVICIRPTEHYTNIFNKKPSGIYEGIRYSYPGKKTVRVKSFWRRRTNDSVAIISSILLFIRLLQKKEVSFCIFYGNNFLAEILFILISRMYLGNIFKEESENPNIYFKDRKSTFNKIIKWFVIGKLYSYYDGVLVMTKSLYNFFIENKVENSKILIVPQTVDLDRFERESKWLQNKFKFDYIGYVGSLNQKKDGILTLVKSFNIVSENYSDLKLLIAGSGLNEEKSALIYLIESLKLEDKVILIGQISSEEIPSFLHHAKVLVSCRPDSIQSNYGFPTKTVEYLATGNPTVSTITGELGFYLNDKINAFIADKAEPDEFASKILEVLWDYDFAIRVAQNGKKLVKDKFNPIIQTMKIIDFNRNYKNKKRKIYYV